MRRKSLLVLLCMVLSFSLFGCGDDEAKSAVNDAAESEEYELAQAAAGKKNTETKPAKVEEKDEAGEPEEDVMTDQELFEAFLKDQAEVHFNNYQPEKYYEFDEYMFKKNDSVTLNELIAVYNKYYLEALSYSDVYYNLSYTYIDAGDAGNQQLVVECGFPQGNGAQFIIAAEDGQLEMMYVIDSRERAYGTVANKYGLITTTGSDSYAEYSVRNEYLDENGEIHYLYTVSVNYLFGQEEGYGDPLLDCAFEYGEKEGFEDDVILRTYSFEEFEADFTEEEEEAYYDNMLRTVEYVTDEEPWHEDEMYEDGSIFSRIFEEAGETLSTPEEIETAIAKKKKELKMPKKAMEEDPVILDDFTDEELGAVLGADITDGKSELEHALTAYTKFLKNPVNMCEILTEQTHSPYGGAQPGLVYGFALRDFTEDGIPELVIDFGQPGFPLMQKIYIYSYYEDDGMVRCTFKMPEGAYGDYGIQYLKDNMDESYLEWFEEDYENKVAECPDYEDSLLYSKYEGPRMVGTCGRYLVTFDEGVEEDMYRNLTWYDFVNDDTESYTEMMAYMEGDDGTYLDFTADESCLEEPEEILDNFKPILFYDITDRNIGKIISEKYWNKNKKNGGFSDYTDEEAYEFLSEKAEWYYDLGIMDDDDSYDTISCYDYDEENDVTTTIYFDLDKRIQSHFRNEYY